MDELFRFVLMRPPVRASKNEVKTLGASFLASGTSWQAAQSAAQKFIQGGKALAVGEEVANAAVARAVVELLRKGPQPAAAVIKLVEGDAGQTPAALLATKQFSTAAQAVSDTLVALKLSSSSIGRDAPDLTTIARGFDAIARTAEGADPVALRPLVLPEISEAPTSTAVGRPPSVSGAGAGASAGAKGQAPAPAPGKPQGENSPAEQQLTQLSEAIEALSGLTAAEFASAVEAAPTQAPRVTRAAQRAAGGAREAAAPGPASGALRVAQPWTLSSATIKSLPKQVQATLQSVGVDPSVQGLPMVLDALHTERVALAHGLHTQLKLDSSEVGGEFVGEPGSPLPSGHGSIQPAGIGDLLLVREHIKGYEGGEISHVENVLQTESMQRDTRRLERTETTLMQEQETTKEEERDTQTTERFSLTQQTSKTIQEEASLKAGLSVDAKYGPFVEVKANAEFATKSSQQESSQQASEYSKDVVARSVSKLIERVRQQRTVTTLQEFEEKYTHGFDNTHGAGNISGVYQWLDEVLEAQIYNYGKRMLFDVTLPEPATAVMLLEASEKPTPQGVTEPPPLTITASDITESNYTEYAQLYGATNIEAPPALVKTFSKPFAQVQGSEPHEGAGTESLSLDSGYAAQYGLFQRDWLRYEEKSPSFKVMIGSNWIDAFGGVGYVKMDGETGTVPIAFDNYQVEAYSMTVEIFCERTQFALEQWALKTFAAIEEAFAAKQTAYRQALSAAQAEAATAAYGRSPGLNAEIINSELRKQCLTLVTGQEFEGFGALEMSSEGYAEPNLERTEQQMPYVRFFEQAFEWEHITYTFHPYFWGWKQAWRKRMLLDDTDPTFAGFLRAGAARVVFPVRPGFEEAVLHYLETGQIWGGGPPPTLNSELYVSIVKEIQEAEGAPGEELPEGEPWPVVLPTTLVRLRPHDDLPEWEKVGEQWKAAN